MIKLNWIDLPSFIEAIFKGVNGFRIYNVRWQIVPCFHGAKVKTICQYPPIAIARFRLMELESCFRLLLSRGKNDLDIIFLLYTLKCLYISPRFLRYSRVRRFKFSAFQDIPGYQNRQEV